MLPRQGPMHTNPSVTERLLDSFLPAEVTAPFITVAIPHYKHRPYLELVLQSLLKQEEADFEIVISDDGSPDDSNKVIPPLLKASGLPFRYFAQPHNLGYDGNVRFCLAAARGRYVLLLGNDDVLAASDTLHHLADALQQLGCPTVAFTNSEDWLTGAPLHRAQATTILGSGPAVALRYFRSFSFVSGLVYERDAAVRYETDRWDQSVYYQIYLASSLISNGGELASINRVVVRKDVRIGGVGVPNYESKGAMAGWSLQSRHTGLDSVARVTFDAVRQSIQPTEWSSAIRTIFTQLYGITYPYWLFEYRRVANLSFAIGVARGLWPEKVLSEYPNLTRTDRLFLRVLYHIVTLVGLLLPLWLWSRLKSSLSSGMRRLQLWRSGVLSLRRSPRRGASL